jgi:hypothetical protein
VWGGGAVPRQNRAKKKKLSEQKVAIYSPIVDIADIRPLLLEVN